MTASLCVTVMVCALLASAAPATAAAPRIKEISFTNPVAYELKSLLTTRFYCTVDQPGVWARLDIMGADGPVKTIYNGPIERADERFWFPLWNGLDSAGRRLPSASYEYRLTVNKGATATTKTGRITVSRINFFLKGTLASQKGKAESRYMLNEAANFYVWGKTLNASQTKLYLSPGPIEYKDGPFTKVLPGVLLTFPNGQTQTQYFRGAQAIPTRGMRDITVSNHTPAFTNQDVSMEYYITVIQ